MDAYEVVEWQGHGKPRARRCSSDGTVAVKQNAPLPWVCKRGKRARVEEVTMVELLTRSIGKWCGDDSERARWSDSDGTVAWCCALLKRWREKSGMQE